MCRTAEWFGVVAFFLLSFPLPVSAASSVVDRTVQRRIDASIGPPLGLPPLLATATDRYVLIRAGGGYVQIIDIANPSVAETTIAIELRRATVGTAFDGNPVDSSSDEWTAARIQERTGKVGLLHGETTVAVGVIMAAFRRARLQPHLVFDKPVYASISPPGALTSAGLNFDRYSEKALPAATVRVAATLSKSEDAAVIVARIAVFLLPCVLVLIMKARKYDIASGASNPTATVLGTSLIVGFWWIMLSGHWQSVTKVRDLW